MTECQLCRRFQFVVVWLSARDGVRMPGLQVSFSVFHSYVQEFGTLEDAGMISKTNHGAASWVLFNSKELRLIGQTREDLDVTCDRKSVRK